MFCTQCGKELRSGLKFCTQCGALIKTADVGKTPAETEDQAQLGQGAENHDSLAGQMGRAENGRKRNNMWKRGIISIVVLIFLSILTVVLWVSGGREWIMDFLPGNDVATTLKAEDADGKVDSTENGNGKFLPKENQDTDISGTIKEMETKENNIADDVVKKSETEHIDISDIADSSKTDEPLERRMDGAKEDEEGEMESEYILPESDSRFLTKEDLNGFDADMCRLARNELYARHGRKFNDLELQEYFNRCSWYEGSIEGSDFEESLLNDFEIANRDLIVAYEEEMGYR